MAFIDFLRDKLGLSTNRQDFTTDRVNPALKEQLRRQLQNPNRQAFRQTLRVRDNLSRISPFRNTSLQPLIDQTQQNLKDLPKGVLTALVNPFMTGEQLLKFNPKVLEEDYAKRIGGTFFDTASLGVGGAQIKGAIKGAKLARPVLKTIGTRGAEGAGFGGIRAASQGEDIKTIAQHTALGGVLGGAIGGVERGLPILAKDIKKAFTVDPKTGKLVAKPAFVKFGAKPEAPFNTGKYVKEQVAKQKTAEGKISLIDKSKSFLKSIKTKIEDTNTPIEDVLYKAQKKGKFLLRPTEDISPQIDRVLRSDTLAGQFIKDNNLDKVIQRVKDLDELDQYLIAKQASAVKTTTGRNATKDAALINSLRDKYEPFAQETYKYMRNLGDYMVDSGLVTRRLMDSLRRQYPDYVPLNRIFSEMEKQAIGGVRRPGQTASLGQQSVVRRLIGSEREVESPMGSIIKRTAEAFEQGERNKAAKLLVSYERLPGNPFGLEEIVGAKSPGENTISVLIDGVKKIYKTDPDIAKAAKNLNQQNLGTFGRIIAIPTRILKLGATTLNLPFVAANIVKDQVFAVINSNRALQTSLANPSNFVKALFNSIKRGDLYDDWVRSGASFTSQDIAREQLTPTLLRIRSRKSVPSRIKHVVTHPEEMLRAVEDVIGRSEELTRLQQFGGTRQALLKEGRTATDATILAAEASRKNSANFARRGEWGTVLNAVLPYFNAGIQGARSLRTNLVRRPIQTAAKLGMLIYSPIAVSTMWNLSDPERRAAYDDIPDYEKEKNIIILPPNPVKDENGRWNAIKIPLTPGLSNLGSIARRTIEDVITGSKDQSVAKIAYDLTSAGTSVEPSTNELISKFTPQGLKPFLENFTNTNLFTGSSIVPEYQKDLPPELQVRENTSGTARIIGGILNTSPLKVENTARTVGGGVGQQLLNLSDRALAAGGVIPEEQIGGRGVVEQVSRRFTSVGGGQKVTDLFEDTGDGKTSEQDGVIEHRGRFFVKSKSGGKGFDTRQQAERAVAKDNFDQSGKAFEINSKYVFSREADGSIGTDTRFSYDKSLNIQQMESFQDTDNLRGWFNIAETQIALFEKELRSNTLNPKDRITVENDLRDLITKFNKFKGYNGFTKPKKGKIIKAKTVSLQAPKRVTLKVPTGRKFVPRKIRTGLGPRRI